MKKYLTFVFAITMLWGCARTLDTSQMSPEEHLNYALTLFNEGSHLEALSEFQSILIQYPGSAVNDDAQYYLAMTYFERDQYLLAVYEYSKLIRDIPASPFVPDAQYMLAEAYYQLSPPSSLDQAYSKKAIEEFQAFIDFFPTNDRVDEAEKKIIELNTKLAEKDYNSAVIYEKMEYYNAAIKYYGNVANTYHDTEFAPKALYNKIILLVSKERVAEALSDITTFMNRYPDSPDIAELKELESSLLNE